MLTCWCVDFLITIASLGKEVSLDIDISYLSTFSSVHPTEVSLDFLTRCKTIFKCLGRLVSASGGGANNNSSGNAVLFSLS